MILTRGAQLACLLFLIYVCHASAHRVLKHRHGQRRPAQIGAQLRLILQPLRRPPQVPARSPWSLPLHALFYTGCVLCHGRRFFPTRRHTSQPFQLGLPARAPMRSLTTLILLGPYPETNFP